MFRSIDGGDTTVTIAVVVINATPLFLHTTTTAAATSRGPLGRAQYALVVARLVHVRARQTVPLQPVLSSSTSTSTSTSTAAVAIAAATATATATAITGNDHSPCVRLLRPYVRWRGASMCQGAGQCDDRLAQSHLIRQNATPYVLNVERIKSD